MVATVVGGVFLSLWPGNVAQSVAYCPRWGAAWYGLVKEQAGMPLRSIQRLALLRRGLMLNIVQVKRLFSLLPLD